MNPDRALAPVVPVSDYSQRSVVIRLVADPDASAWDEYVERTPAASLYHLYGWRRLIRSVFGHESSYFAAHDSAGRICGVLPLVRLRSLLFGDFMVSMPYFNYGGVVADSEQVAVALTEHAAGHARELGVSHLELRHNAPLGLQWPVRTDKITMHLTLPASPEALSKQLGSKLRSQIKRPVREGATGVSGGAELLPEFYEVFARNMRDLGTPVYSRTFFAAILAAFPARARIFVVKLKGVAVATGFVIGHRQQLEIPWASSLREANALGVNMLLYWNILEHACLSGYTSFDFGRSTVDGSTYRFKRQWGAEPRQLYWHYWMREGGEPPRLNPSNSRYRLAIAAWQRLPMTFANFLGPLLVRNLP